MRECQILKQEHKVACVKEEQPLAVLQHNILNNKLTILHKGRGGKKEQGGVVGMGQLGA